MERARLSVRIDAGRLVRLDAHAERAGLSRSAMAERYLEEGLRMADHPGIVFADEPAGRRVRLGGTGLDVREAVETLRDNAGTARAAAAYHELPLILLEAAADYYAAFREEIDAEIADNLAEHERLGRSGRPPA